MFKPQRLGTVTIPDAELTTDKKNLQKNRTLRCWKKSNLFKQFLF